MERNAQQWHRRLKGFRQSIAPLELSTTALAEGPNKPLLHLFLYINTMRLPIFSKLILFCSLAVTMARSRRPSGSIRPVGAHVTIINESPSKVGIFWVNLNSPGDNLRIGEIVAHERVSLDSFVGHEFEIHEMPDETTGECNAKDKTCRVTYFPVKDGDKQMYSINDSFEVVYDDISKPDEELIETNDYASYCKRKALEGQFASHYDKELIMSRFKSCMSLGVGHRLQSAEDEVAFEQDVRQTVAGVSLQSNCSQCALASSRLAYGEKDQRRSLSLSLWRFVNAEYGEFHLRHGGQGHQP